MIEAEKQTRGTNRLWLNLTFSGSPLSPLPTPVWFSEAAVNNGFAPYTNPVAYTHFNTYITLKPDGDTHPSPSIYYVSAIPIKLYSNSYNMYITVKLNGTV